MNTSGSPPGEQPRRGGLARSLQETFTVVGRLRARGHQMPQVEAFRDKIRRLLSAAHEEARRAGYSREDVKGAIYAVTVFVDESVLNSGDPAFAEWERRPLQEELFGGYTGGEVFFEQLRGLLKRPDTVELADVLEVYQLCMLLGYQGRYADPEHGELRRWRKSLAHRIAAVRGVPAGLAPESAPPEREVIPPARDAWTRRLAVAFVVALGLLFLSFIAFSYALESRIQDLQRALTGFGR